MFIPVIPLACGAYGIDSHATRQRDLVAEIVFLSDDHPSVDAILRRLKERGEAVGTATVYRTLQLLAEHDEVDRGQRGLQQL